MPDAEGPAGPVTRALRATGRALLGMPAPFALALVVAWAALIWWLSGHASPRPAVPSPLWEWLSNLAHAPLFGLLTLFGAGLVLRDAGAEWPRVWSWRGLAVLASTFAYGVIDEWHQSHVEGRDASALDVVTDVVAAACVLWIVGTLGERGVGERRVVGRMLVGGVVCGVAAGVAMVG